MRLAEFDQLPDIYLGVPGPFRVLATIGDVSSPVVIPFPSAPLRVRVGPDGRFFLDDSRLPAGVSAVRFELATPAATNAPAASLFSLRSSLTGDPLPVRGSVTFRLAGAGTAAPVLDAILTIDLETYVAGSVTAEMPRTFGPNALAAQAIAIRTFALYKLYDYAAKPPGAQPTYDVQSSVADLRYGGVAYEHTEARQAAARTRGMVLTYEGRLFPTFFHSTSGGRTVPVDRVFNGYRNFPPLAGRVNSPSEQAPLHRWTSRLDWPAVRAALIGKRLATEAQLGSQLIAIRHEFADGRVETAPVSLDPAERPVAFVVETEFGRVRIQANRFRLAVGGGRDGLPSTAVIFAVAPGGVIQATGGGFGHGVGLCQYGSKALDAQGLSFEAILRHYYPQTALTRHHS